METGLHAFRDYPSIKEAFDLCNLSRLLPDGIFSNCKEWLESVARGMDSKQFPLFIALLWNLWNRRNKWIHDAQLIPHRMVVDYAQLLSTDFLNAQEAGSSSNGSTTQENWSKPLQNGIKINVDGAFNPTIRKAAIGVIARNSHGMMSDGCAFQFRGYHTADSAEACAFKEGIRMAISNGWSQVMFEGDACNIVAKLEMRELDRSLAAYHLSSTIKTLINYPGANKSKRSRLAVGKRLYKSSIQQRAKTSVGMKMRANRMAEMMEEKRRMEESLRASRRDAAEAEERLRLVETTRNWLLLQFNGITILFMLLGALEALLILALPFY
ncbi:hypothetical protein GQ457_06G017780 [Hibiscus cannabinus]